MYVPPSQLDRLSRAEREEGCRFAPCFDAKGLMPAIAVDAETGAVLMMAYMNETALARTLETGEAWYWSRSRQSLWHKGETSGQIQQIVDMWTDCDQDALVLAVRVGGDGGVCHTGRRTCFYRRIVRDEQGSVRLETVSKRA